ncbi:acetyl-CoA C-acetyltransferase [Rhodococcus fascians]|nr:acetyl-CoA C-acetyltransferase [Rhodococcus fascians]MBY4238366.1 acetyl-CoA C-acetyltransferase [Rhodococcus fascians]MBY4254253.1 acetyl-CoA C-acetyltransferase [Rhodococcus fascians]MBY4269634.1 acetyl-CoA C-acetyltransferase [Rhodococcus fascians]
MPEAVIVAIARSPIGRAIKGSLADMRPDDLAVQMVRAALEKVPALDPSSVVDLMVGCGQPGGEQGFNLGRNVAIQLGYDAIPGTTVTRYCASSLQTSRMAMHAIRAGEGDAFISAGVETVSRFHKGESDSLPDTQNPIYQEAQNKTEERSSSNKPWTDPRSDGNLPDAYISMGETAENVATLAGITRDEQDQWALRSQMRTATAIRNGHYAHEITPVQLYDGTTVTADDSPRPGTTMDKLSALPPVFRAGGTVTAGNACPLNDGAAALVIMSDTRARELGITPLARIVATSVTGISPEIMGLGPVEATKRVLDTAGMTLSDIDLTEINEAFASQVLACSRALDLDENTLNVSGGALALGHPFGMTGARITASLLNNLTAHDREIGLETMCVGGGQGMAMILERL